MIERQPEYTNPPEHIALNNLSFGMYLPWKTITNEQIEQWGIQTKSGKPLTASYIQEKIGIARRFRANSHESTIYMGVQAATATEDLQNIDAVLVSSSYPVGVNISKEIAARLQIKPSPHLDIHAACSGFVRGLAYMKEHEEEFQGKKVLFVATERYSPTLTDLREGGTKIDPSMAQTIFSDGAAAMVFTYGEDIQVLEHGSEKLPKDSDNYIRMPIDRELMIRPFLEVPIPNSTNGKLQQEGPKVFEAILLSVPDLNRRVIEKSGLGPSDIKLVIPHQTSGRMIDRLTKKMLEYNMFTDIDDGNFSSASIPKALMRAIREGVIQKGNKILLSGFGAGLYASSAIVELG